MTRHSKKQENKTHYEEKIQSTGTDPELTQAKTLKQSS